MLVALLGLAMAIPFGTIPVQGDLSDAAGHPLVGPRTVRVSLWSAASGGSPTWADDVVVDFQEGAFTLVLGLDGDLDLAVFEQPRWLSITLTGDTESHRVPVGTAPRAAFAENAARLGGRDAARYLHDASA